MWTATLDMTLERLESFPSFEDLVAKAYPDHILAAMERMRQDVLRLISTPTPHVRFSPHTNARDLNAHDWPQYKRASALIGYAFEAYVARAFHGRKFGGRVPLATDPDIIIPTLNDPDHNRIYMECKCGNGDALLKILQSSKQAADGPIYYAIGFHELEDSQKKVSTVGATAILDMFPLKSLWILPADAIKKWLIHWPRDAKHMKHYPNDEHYISLYENDAKNIFESLQGAVPTSEIGNIHVANLALGT